MTLDLSWQPPRRFGRTANRVTKAAKRRAKRTPITRRTPGVLRAGVRRGEATRKRRLQLLLLAGLLGVNLAVFLYHGDPREDPMKPRAPAGGEKQAEPVAAASERHAAADESGAEEMPATFDPMLGMRVPGPVQRVEVLRLRSGQTVAAALAEVRASSDDVAGALESLKGLVDFRRLRPGNTIKARFDDEGRMLSLDIHSSLLDRARASRVGDGWKAAPIEVPVQTVVAQVSGRVDSSLWDALVSAGESPQLVSDVVDMFAWDVDFYTELFPGDTFRLLVEKRYVDGELAGYGALLAGELVTNGVPHEGFRFVRADGGTAYYDAEGHSLRKQLLRSPLKYGHVTSGFGWRKHPILGYSRAHNGIDYGVPIGTPVWTVGDGTVVRAGWHGGFGKLIEIRHPNGWLSQYGHLSRINVRAGQHVTQKQIIGYSGSTGLSTGPHLHYGLEKNGAYVNPQSQRFERGKPLSGEDLEKFRAEVERLLAALRQIRIVDERRPNAGGAREPTSRGMMTRRLQES